MRLNSRAAAAEMQNAKKTNVTISKKNRWDKQCATERALRRAMCLILKGRRRNRKACLKNVALKLTAVLTCSLLWTLACFLKFGKVCFRAIISSMCQNRPCVDGDVLHQQMIWTQRHRCMHFMALWTLQCLPCHWHVAALNMDGVSGVWFLSRPALRLHVTHVS